MVYHASIQKKKVQKRLKPKFKPDFPLRDEKRISRKFKSNNSQYFVKLVYFFRVHPVDNSMKIDTEFHCYNYRYRCNPDIPVSFFNAILVSEQEVIELEKRYWVKK